MRKLMPKERHVKAFEPSVVAAMKIIGCLSRLSSFWLILRRWKLVRIRSACAGRTQEDLAAIGESDITRVRALFGMVTRLVAVNDDFESRGKGGLVDPAPKQG